MSVPGVQESSVTLDLVCRCGRRASFPFNRFNEVGEVRRRVEMHGWRVGGDPGEDVCPDCGRRGGTEVRR